MPPLSRTDDDLDAFDFDVSMPDIVDADDDASREAVSVPFMLGDYSEKGHFPPSSSVVRNEVLEGVSLSESDGVAFQCIYCKDATQRADMAVMFPQNVMSILDCFIEFQRIHLPQCTCIPRDTRECVRDFKKLEEKHQPLAMIADDPFLWISSAIRRGLRDRKGGGIVYCPELAASQEEPAANQELDSRVLEEEFIEPGNYFGNYFEHENLQLTKDLRELFEDNPEPDRCDELMTMAKPKKIAAKENFW